MKYFKVLIILLFCICIITGCGKKNETKETDKKDEKVEQHQKVVAESFEFTTNSVNFENNNSVFDINVKNISNEERYINEFLIHVKDKEGKELAVLFGYVNETIEANGERLISCSYGEKLSNYSSLEFEVLK